MKTKIIQYKGVGEIEIMKTRRTRGMSLKIHPIKGVCVSIPSHWSYKGAEEILRENQEWVNRSIQKLSATEKKSAPFTEDSNFKTKYHDVKILPWIGRDVSYTDRENVLNIYYPENRNVTDSDIQEQIRYLIEETYRKEAKQYLTARLAYLAKEKGFKYNGITIKNMKSRWGSCTALDHINLSLHLLRIPEELSDYVILHELCHTVHKNHSKRFWELLCNICPEAKAKDKEMRKYNAQVY